MQGLGGTGPFWDGLFIRGVRGLDLVAYMSLYFMSLCIWLDVIYDDAIFHTCMYSSHSFVYLSYQTLFHLV